MHSSSLLHVLEQIIGSCILQSLQGKKPFWNQWEYYQNKEGGTRLQVSVRLCFISTHIYFLGFIAALKCWTIAFWHQILNGLKQIQYLFFKIHSNFLWDLNLYGHTQPSDNFTYYWGAFNAFVPQMSGLADISHARFSYCLQWKFHMRSGSRLICRQFCSSLCYKITRTCKGLLRKYQSDSLMTIKVHKMSPEQQQHLFNCQHILKDLMQPLWLPSRKNKGTKNHFPWALEQQQYNLFLNNPSL